MTKAIYYHNPRCSKSRQGLALLEENSYQATVKEYLKEGLTKVELKNIVGKLDGDFHALVRSKEAEFKDSGLTLKDLSKDEVINLLAQTPKLLERPLLVTSGQAIIGRPPENFLPIIS